MVVSVTVRDSLFAPVTACSLRLDYGGSFSVHSELDTSVFPYAGHLCGTGVQLSVTDLLGVAEFRIEDGGGAGTLVLDATVTALCANPEVELGIASDTFCVRSTDVNGDQIVNFLDQFDFIPQTAVGVGFASDLNCTPPINAFDYFSFLPELNQGNHCLESVTLIPVDLPDCSGKLDKRGGSANLAFVTGRLGFDRN